MRGVPEGLRIDLGCGSNKKEGTVGLDIQPLPGVDYVLDLQSQPLPFDDRSVAYVYSYHLLEHLEEPSKVFEEVSRVCADGARLEFWTPYGWSNSAFILGHRNFFTEDIYLHICVVYADFWTEGLGARWILNELQYVVEPETLCYLKKNRIGLDFAIGHLHNVVTEFCAYMTVLHNDIPASPPPFRRTFSAGHFAPRYEIRRTGVVDKTPCKIERAIQSFANRGGPLPSA